MHICTHNSAIYADGDTADHARDNLAELMHPVAVDNILSVLDKAKLPPTTSPTSSSSSASSSSSSSVPHLVVSRMKRPKLLDGDVRTTGTFSRRHWLCFFLFARAYVSFSSLCNTAHALFHTVLSLDAQSKAQFCPSMSEGSAKAQAKRAARSLKKINIDDIDDNDNDDADDDDDDDLASVHQTTEVAVDVLFDTRCTLFNADQWVVRLLS
jgi:hypothetical protein